MCGKTRQREGTKSAFKSPITQKQNRHTENVNFNEKLTKADTNDEVKRAESEEGSQ